MEKPSSRSSSTKSSNSDNKVKQDVANKHLRLPRIKDNISPRPDSRRKPNPQRNRELFDKRPKNRSGAVCGKYRSQVEVDETIDEGYAKHNKKVNLNHLLNFTVIPLDHKDGYKRTGFNRNKPPKYNKELFLQANCQFVVSDNGNYSVHEKNPDILVEWALIEEIRLPSHEMSLCPICLYNPIASKITRCGHIYCWPCILHYLSLTDRTWQKCPICYEAVYKNELKSVSLIIQKSFHVGDEITMCLLKRDKGSLLPTPVAYECSNQLCNVDSGNNIACFRKLLLANEKDINSIISREKSELDKAYAQEKETPEVCFIEAALKLLEEREKSIKNEVKSVSLEVKKTTLDPHCVADSFERNRIESLSSTDSCEELFASELEHFSDFHLAENMPSNAATLDENKDLRKGISYFYQAEDGQHIYLHNLNVRMLLKEYDSLGNAPPLIKAKIVDIESASMTDVLRKRLRYLQHLPLTCEFQIVELNFSSLLQKSTLHLFEAEINKRKQFRSRKARNERRRERYIEQEENKKVGKYPKATYNLQSVHQFPSCQHNDFQGLSSPKHSCLENSACSADLQSSPEAKNNIQEEDSFSHANCLSYTTEFESTPSTSFAQMLKDGPKTFSQTLKERKVESKILHRLIDDSDDENWIPPPEYHQSFSDALQVALESVSIQESAGNAIKTGKKKKGKKQLLFTTSMYRNK